MEGQQGVICMATTKTGVILRVLFHERDIGVFKVMRHVEAICTNK